MFPGNPTHAVEQWSNKYWVMEMSKKIIFAAEDLGSVIYIDRRTSIGIHKALKESSWIRQAMETTQYKYHD
jgi:hypothetical protein